MRAMTFIAVAVAASTLLACGKKEEAPPAESPTPPLPKTASHSPGRSAARPVSACHAVVTRQPSAAASAGSIVSGSAVRL